MPHDLTGEASGYFSRVVNELTFTIIYESHRFYCKMATQPHGKCKAGYNYTLVQCTNFFYHHLSSDFTECAFIKSNTPSLSMRCHPLSVFWSPFAACPHVCICLRLPTGLQYNILSGHLIKASVILDAHTI